MERPRVVAKLAAYARRDVAHAPRCVANGRRPMAVRLPLSF